MGELGQFLRVENGLEIGLDAIRVKGGITISKYLIDNRRGRLRHISRGTGW